MEDCKTPTFQQIEFLFNITPTMVTDVNRLQEVRHLRVNKFNVRQFTPTLSDFRSPGLSPIYTSKKIHPEQGITTMEGEFKTPALVSNKNRYDPSPTAPPKPQQIQQQPPQTTEGDIFIATPSAFEITGDNFESMNSTFKSPTSAEDINLNSSPALEASKGSDSTILDRTLSVISLLKNIGMVKYGEVFAKEGVDLERFLSMQPTDLYQMGIRCEEHSKVILDLVRELNVA